MILKYSLLFLTVISFAASEEARSCRCPDTTLQCIIQEMRNSTDGICPPCPAPCSPSGGLCAGAGNPCGSGEPCIIIADSSSSCSKVPEVNEDCSFISNCHDPRGCDDVILPGIVGEYKCASGLFCRENYRKGCHIFGTCVRANTSHPIYARCTRDPKNNASLCHADGDFKCSKTETSDDGNQVQTCYNTTDGQVLKTFPPTTASRISEDRCRALNPATCRKRNGRVVLSGDKIEDPADRCSFCTCQNGMLNLSSCTTNTRCVPNPASCTHNGINVPHGRVVNMNSCVQSRCDNGIFLGTRDTDCDGADDTDPCSGASEADREVVCATTPLGLKQRTQKCRAMDLGTTRTNGRCGDDETCSCGKREICVERTESLDLCIQVNSNGCKKKKCIPLSDYIECSVNEIHQKVCSSAGTTFPNQCIAYVYLDHNIKCLGACNETICTDTNDGKGFCGFDGITYATLGELELKTGLTKVDYRGTCEMNRPGLIDRCDPIPDECLLKTKTSDAVCPIAGGQAVLYIDVHEAHEFAISREKSELTGGDLCKVALVDWLILTTFDLSDSSCEVSCRPKYDTLGALILEVRAKQFADCTTCGDRTKVFVNNLREDKAKWSSGVNRRRRRQTDESQPLGSGLFFTPNEGAIPPIEVASPSPPSVILPSRAISLLASSLLVFISFMLAFIFTSY